MDAARPGARVSGSAGARGLTPGGAGCLAPTRVPWPRAIAAAARAAPAAQPVLGREGTRVVRSSARPLPAPPTASRSLAQPPAASRSLPPQAPLWALRPGSERLPAELLLRRSQRAPPASALQAFGSRGSHLLGKTPASCGPSPDSHPGKDRALWGPRGPGSSSVPALSLGRAASTPGLGAGQAAWCPCPLAWAG